MPILVNGERVEDSVIRDEMRDIRPRYEEAVQDLDPIQAEIQLREWSRENVIERVLLRQEAARDPEPLDQALIEQTLEQIRGGQTGQPGCQNGQVDEQGRLDIEARLRVDRLTQKIVGKAPPPKYKDVGDYYKKHKDEFWTAEMLRAAHIVKNVDEKTDEATALAEMQKVEAELAAGADFSELADKYSDCPGRGGDLGTFPRGEMVEEFDEVAFALQPGELSPIFRTSFGYHIAKVFDRKPAGALGLQQVRAQIEQTLHRQKQERAVEEFLDRLRAKAVVEDVR